MMTAIIILNSMYAICQKNTQHFFQGKPEKKRVCECGGSNYRKDA